MNATTPKYWFPAKRYGWGWGVPTAWQGWVFLVGWLAVLLVNRFSIPHRLPQYPLFIVAMIALLLLVCCWKGEPPGWRWGDRKN